MLRASVPARCLEVKGPNSVPSLSIHQVTFASKMMNQFVCTLLSPEPRNKLASHRIVAAEVGTGRARESSVGRERRDAMTTQDLLIGEINVVSDFVEMLARRRAHGEVSELYPDLRDVSETI